MSMLRKYSWVLSVATFGLVVGAVVVGSIGGTPAAQSATPNTVVDQGNPGPPWNIAGNVGFSTSLPPGPNNIGSVGLSSPLPAGSNNIGHVNVDNLPAVQAVSAGGTLISTGTSTTTAVSAPGGMSGFADISAYKEIRVVIANEGGAATWSLAGQIGSLNFGVAGGTMNSAYTIHVYQVPALAIRLTFTSSTPSIVSWAIAGWAT
jgi:hypothetical protein